jgi:hypothetical protein
MCRMRKLCNRPAAYVRVDWNFSSLIKFLIDQNDFIVFCFFDKDMYFYETFEPQVQNMATSVNLSLSVHVSITKDNNSELVEIFLLLSILDIQLYCRFYFILFFFSRICSLCHKSVSCVIFVNTCDTQEYLNFFWTVVQRPTKHKWYNILPLPIQCHGFWRNICETRTFTAQWDITEHFSS